jgi:hypothetical protein
MTKTKQAVRSIERPGQPKANMSGMPYGTGSIQMRGRVWWIVYRDPQGRGIQENTRTEDFNAALRMLAERALETARARVTALERIIHETAQKEGAAHPRSDEARHGEERATRRRPVRDDAAVRGTGKTKKGGRR